MACSENNLPSDTRRRLLQVARETAERALGAPSGADQQDFQIDGQFGGAFVTFWAGKALRGCVGTFLPTTEVVGTIRQVTRSSLADPRFRSHPITASELPKIDIEISLLSSPEPTDDPAGLVPGTHGILIRRGEQSGCFLPKVATDRGWSAEEFLSNCCTMKAGLTASAWKNPDTEILLFTAEVFSESSSN